MKCEICGSKCVDPENVGDYTCPHCGQEYEYTKNANIILSLEQIEALRKLKNL